jgi:hypothetical protein
MGSLSIHGVSHFHSAVYTVLRLYALLQKQCLCVVVHGIKRIPEARWLTPPVILTTQETEIKRFAV